MMASAIVQLAGWKASGLLMDTGIEGGGLAVPRGADRAQGNHGAIQAQWAWVKGRLKSEFGEATYGRWPAADLGQGERGRGASRRPGLHARLGRDALG